MSSNNFILISEQTKDIYKVSENDAESNIEIKNIGTFDSLKTAVEKAEEYISGPEIEIEYGIRFSLNKIVNTELIKKDFDKWNERKKEVDKSILLDDFFFYEREIWWCSMGKNIGVEVNGKDEGFERPGIILRVFNKDMVWILPITSSVKKSKFYYNFIFNKIEQFVMLTQIKTISSKRLRRKIGTISDSDFEKILTEFISLVKNETPPVKAGNLGGRSH